MLQQAEQSRAEKTHMTQSSCIPLQCSAMLCLPRGRLPRCANGQLWATEGCKGASGVSQAMNKPCVIPVIRWRQDGQGACTRRWAQPRHTVWPQGVNATAGSDSQHTGHSTVVPEAPWVRTAARSDADGTAFAAGAASFHEADNFHEASNFRQCP